MSLPRMSWHIGDYKRDTGHLRAAGHGAYFLLTMHYWATGGLPDDDKQLAAIASMTDKEWKANRPVIAAFFQPGWKHKRIDWELGQATAAYERRAEAGRKSGKARAKNEHCSNNEETKPDDCSSNPNPIPKASKEDTAGAVPTPGLSSATPYAFESGVIRLKKKDFDQWKQAFSHLDLGAELLALTEWAGIQGQKWFFAVSSALAKKNREIGIRLEQQKSGPEYKWNGIEGVV